MHVFELFELIRKKPGFFIDGDKSLKRIRSFVVGFEVGTAQKELQGAEDLQQFNSWVAKRLGHAGSSKGWCQMVIEQAGSDEKAFELFFELLNEYKSQKV